VDLADTLPNSEYADDALYWAGQAAFIQEKYKAAGDTWARLVDSYPDGDLVNFGRYWQAKSLLEMGQADQARQVLSEVDSDSLDYYSLRARNYLAGDQPHTVPLSFPTKPELAREQREAERWLARWLELDSADNLAAIGPQLSNDPAFNRGRALLEIGLREEALVEFETVKDTWWDDPLAMYQLSVYFREQGLGRLSIRTAARLTVLSPADEPAQAPIFIQHLLYPVYFEEIILAEAEKYDLDPALILAIMRQESLFERSAESIAGARGLMQVMPATGEYIVERAGFDSYDPDQLWLPYLSIRYGAWYINQQLGIFDGNQFAALAAYNAGPGNVLEWIKVSDDLDVFVEAIPFWESRTYIRNIYINLAAYRRIYGQ
jgi:soluble lytic murein transglycosylase